MFTWIKDKIINVALPEIKRGINVKANLDSTNKGAGGHIKGIVIHVKVSFRDTTLWDRFYTFSF